MRVSGNAIRLAALVAAATTSGYLWRAALESPGGTTVIRLAPSATPPVQVIAAPHDPVSSSPAKAHPARQPQHARPAELAATRVAAPASTTQGAPHSQPTPPPHPSSPPPKPTPPPVPQPTPQPTPTPTPTTTTQPPPTPSQPVASSPPPPPQSTPPTDSSDESKPGWGNGDKNHHHDGPPGKHG